MSSEDALGSTGVAQVPEHDYRRLVVLRCRDEASSLLWVPADVAHTTSLAHLLPSSAASKVALCGSSTILQERHLLGVTDIPDRRESRRRRSREDTLNRWVPLHGCDLVELCGLGSWSDGCAKFLQVVNVEFCIDTTRQQEVLLDAVEVESPHRSSVDVALVGLRLLTVDDLDRVVEIQFSSLHTCSNYTAPTGSRARLRPCQAVEPVVSYLATSNTTHLLATVTEPAGPGPLSPPRWYA